MFVLSTSLMKKTITYFDTPDLGVSDNVLAEVEKLQAQGFSIFALTNKLANYPNHAVRHLHEPRYGQHMASIRSKLRLYHVHVQHIDTPIEPQETVEDESETQTPPTGEETLIEIPVEAQARERKSTTAPVYVFFNNSIPVDRLSELAEDTADKGNRIWIAGATVNDLPADTEARFDLKPEKLYDFTEVRAVVTNCYQTAIEAIAQGVPVAFLDWPLTDEDELEGFYESEISGVTSASVTSTEDRQALLDHLNSGQQE